jgi:hypothetical protein
MVGIVVAGRLGKQDNKKNVQDMIAGGHLGRKFRRELKN